MTGLRSYGEVAEPGWGPGAHARTQPQCWEAKDVIQGTFSA